MLSIRLGLPIVGGQLPAAARALGCPTLVSANALAIYRGAGTEREFTRFRVLCGGSRGSSPTTRASASTAKSMSRAPKVTG